MTGWEVIAPAGTKELTLFENPLEHDRREKMSRSHQLFQQYEKEAVLHVSKTLFRMNDEIIYEINHIFNCGYEIK